MAARRLSGEWIYEVLRREYPNGVVRRALLDAFAVLLINPRCSRGAKGRLARKLYVRLASLQRRGLVQVEEGIVRPLAVGRKVTKAEAAPLLTPVLNRKLFAALMAEDGQGDGHNASMLHTARWAFLAAAVEAGWSVGQGAEALGISTKKAEGVLSRAPAA